jgi:hypothetical protein
VGDAPVYDAVELRRRIVVCFSMSELRELADALGVGGVAWDRGPQEAARELVRQCDRYAGLPALVAKLREVRPLMEWPEPAAPQALAQPFLAPAADPLAPSAFPVMPTLPSTPGVLQRLSSQPPQPPAPTQEPAPQSSAAPRASPSGPPIADPFGSPAPGPPAIGAPPFPGQPSPIWPGTYVAPPQRTGLDPRLIAAGIGLTALLGAAVVIAFLAGRATGGDGAGAAPSTSSTAPPGGARRADGPAVMVTDAIARSLANVARACELPPSVGDSVAVFVRVYERCGPQPLQPRSSLPAAPAPAPEPADTTAEPAARPRKQGRGDAPPAPAPAQGCFGRCNTDHRACDAHCGPEPNDSGSYANYQRCLGRCLSDSSRCMQSCR